MENLSRDAGRRAWPTALLLLLLCLHLSCARPAPTLQTPFVAVRTVAGAQTGTDSARFGDPFGVAAGPDGTVYLSDGEQGRVWQIQSSGAAKVLAENLNAPSALAVAPDGTLFVADTGSHTIKRVNLQGGGVTLVAGSEGRAGYADGQGAEALFNGPVGLTVGPDGTVYVADTYNDRIRAIDTQGRVRTLAGGGEPGYADAEAGEQARFNTPCGIAVDKDGSLIVADTGNHRLRRVGPGGDVTTIAGTGTRGVIDSPTPSAASFNEPTAVAVDEVGVIYVADAGGSAVRAVSRGFWPGVRTIAGHNYPGLSDGSLDGARLSRPSGLALSADGTLFVADTGNKLLRAVVREGTQHGAELTVEAVNALRQKPAEFRTLAPPRWPYDPPDKTREIAATFGEIRGEISEGEDAWFHNGLDIPGAYGETARFVRTERVLRPLSVEDVGSSRERLRLPSMGYIHLRVGRDRDDQPFDDGRFVVMRDDGGRVARVRVRRGASFSAGEAVGTLNNQNHVHLIAGSSGNEFNALAALELPGVKDSVSPIIEKDGVHLYDGAWKEFKSGEGKGAKGEGGGLVTVRGDVRVVVRAYDQMDGNASRRRLGLYRLGYQVLNRDGSPAAGYESPRWTISFESLPDDFRAAPVAYASGSKSGATGETIFAYIVTNVVRDREAREGFWRAAELGEGDYTLRVFAADFFGNTTTRDVGVRVER